MSSPPRADCLALDFGRALHGPQQREGRWNVALADRDSMIAQHQHMFVAEARQHAAALLGVQCNAFKIVIADAAVELRAVEIIVVETAALHGDRRYRGGVRVRHAADIRTAFVNHAVQGKAGRVGRVIGRLYQAAVHSHLQQVLRSDFKVVEPERIDQVVMRRAGQSHRDMVEYQLRPAEKIDEMIEIGEFASQAPLLRVRCRRGQASR